MTWVLHRESSSGAPFNTDTCYGILLVGIMVCGFLYILWWLPSTNMSKRRPLVTPSGIADEIGLSIYNIKSTSSPRYVLFMTNLKAFADISRILALGRSQRHCLLIPALKPSIVSREESNVKNGPIIGVSLVHTWFRLFLGYPVSGRYLNYTGMFSSDIRVLIVVRILPAVMSKPSKFHPMILAFIFLDLV